MTLSLGVYDKGDQVRFTWEFRDLAGTLTDPTAIAVTILPPTGAAVTKAITDLTRDSLGTFHLDYTLTPYAPGDWTIRAEASGTIVVADEQTLTMKRSRILDNA